MKLQAIIFDVDGTLADTERDGHRPAFNAAFAEAGLDWQWSVERYGELLAVTGGKERIQRYMQEEDIVPAPGVDVDELVASLHRAKTRHYVSLIEAGAIALRLGVARLLREARDAGVRLAIATTTTPRNVEVLLDNCGVPGVRSWFEVVAAGDVVPQKKPAPDIYLLALEQLGLGPQDCVAVEDSDNGVRSALAADLDALLVTESTYTTGQDFGTAPLVMDSLGEPGTPARVVSGDAGGAEYVDIAVLRRLHATVYPGS